MEHKLAFRGPTRTKPFSAVKLDGADDPPGRHPFTIVVGPDPLTPVPLVYGTRLPGTTTLYIDVGLLANEVDRLLGH